MPEQIPRYLNNGYGFVPQLPGNGRFDVQELGNSGSGLSFLSTMSGLLPGVGGLLSTGLNLIGMNIQNRKQEQMYEQRKYLSLSLTS